MSDLDRVIADLKDRRLALGLTQRQVAARSKIAQSLICSYETRRLSPTSSKLVAWANGLDCDVTITIRQAGRCGLECSEGHTYEAGRCEQAAAAQEDR